MDKWQKHSALSFNDHLKSNIQPKVQIAEAPKRRVLPKNYELKQEEYKGPFEHAQELIRDRPKHDYEMEEADDNTDTIIRRKGERMLEKLRENIRNATMDQLCKQEGVERGLTVDSNVVTAQIQSELRKKGKLDNLNKITREVDKPSGSQLSASGISTKYLEGFINEKLLMAQKHNFPMVIRRPEHMHPLERYDLSRIQLLEIGLLQSEIDRLYRALYVYTFGFFAILKDYGAKLDNRMKKHKVDISNYLESNIWHVYQVLIDLACPQDFKGILAQKEDKHQKEMNKQYEYLTALEEEQIKKSAALRSKMAELQSELNEVDSLKTQFYNEQRELTAKNTQLKERLEEEITLRMKFEQKINVGFMVNNQTAESHTLLQDKYERLQVENIKTENELKLLKIEYRKLQDFKDNNIDKIQNYNAEVNSHDIFRLDQQRKESQLHHQLAQIREEINKIKHENKQIKVKDASLYIETQTLNNKFEAISKYSENIQEFYDQQQVQIDKMKTEWKEDKDKIVELNQIIIKKDLYHTLDKVAYQDIKRQLEEKIQEYEQLQKLKNESDMKCITTQRLHVMADLKEGMNKKIRQTMVDQLNEVTASKIDTEKRLKLQMEHNYDVTQQTKQVYILYKQMSLDAVNAHNKCDYYKVENEQLKIQCASLNARIREMNDSTKKQIVTLRQHIHYEQDERESQVEAAEKAKYHIEHFKKENQKAEHEVVDIKHELSRYTIENEVLKKEIKTMTAEHHERLMDKNAEIYQLQELRDTNQTLQQQINQKQNISEKEINIWKNKVNIAKIEMNNIQMAINDMEAKKNNTDSKLQETLEVLETTKVELKRFKEKYYAVAIQMQFAIGKKRQVETEAKEALRIRDKQAYDIASHIKEIAILRYKVDTTEGLNALQKETNDELLQKKMELEGQIVNLKTEIERVESNLEELREVVREGKKEMAEGESQTTIKYFDSKPAQTGNELSVHLALRMSMSNMLKNKEYLESSKAVSTIPGDSQTNTKYLQNTTKSLALGSQKSQNLGSNKKSDDGAHLLPKTRGSEEKQLKQDAAQVKEFPNVLGSDKVFSNDKNDEKSERNLNLDKAQTKAQDDGDISHRFLSSLIEENELDKLVNPNSKPMEQIETDARKQSSQDSMANSGTHDSVETLQTMRLANQQEQIDVTLLTSPQPEHGQISDRNYEVQQSYQADVYQTIESKRSKKQFHKIQNSKAAKKRRPKAQIEEDIFNQANQPRQVSEKPINRKIEIISKFKTYTRILGKLILERPTSQFDSIQVAQAKRYLKTKNMPPNLLTKQMTNILKNQLAYKVKVQQQNAQVQKEINKLGKMTAISLTPEDEAKREKSELNSPGESSIQSFGNQLIRKKLTEETVIKFMEEKCQTNIRYLKKFIINLNNSDILKQHAKIDFEILNQDKKSFYIKDQFDFKKQNQQNKQQVETLAYKSNYDISKYKDDRASIGMSPRTQTASTSFFKHDAKFKIHRRSKNMSIMNQYKEDNNKDLIDVLVKNKTTKPQSQSQQRMFVKRNAARNNWLDGRLDSTNINLQGGRLSILPHTRGASINMIDTSPAINHKTVLQASLRTKQKDFHHRNSCQLIDVVPSFAQKKHNRFGSLDFIQNHQGTSTSQFIDHNQDDGQYPYQSINYSPNDDQRMITQSTEIEEKPGNQPRTINLYGVREKPRTSDVNQRKKMRKMLQNQIIANV